MEKTYILVGKCDYDPDEVLYRGDKEGMEDYIQKRLRIASYPLRDIRVSLEGPNIEEAVFEQIHKALKLP